MSRNSRHFALLRSLAAAVVLLTGTTGAVACGEVFSTFGGEIVAIESNVSVNGKFRVLVKEDTNDRPWPKQLKIGTGAQGITLLKDVQVWYELWRNINGFPPDYYKKDESALKEKK